MSAEFIKLFIAGFVSFFATGLDDTVAYASIIKSKREKMIISSGILTATALSILLAVFLSSLVQKLPNPHLIAGFGMIGLGVWVWSGIGLNPHPAFTMLTQHPEKYNVENVVSAPRLFFRGFISFFITGVDDIIAYSFLMTTPTAVAGLTTGIFVATFVDLGLVFYMAGRLKKLKHSKEIGGGLLMTLGVAILLGLF